MDRDELHQRVMLLKEELEAGRIKFPPDLRVVESLARVRYGPDGKVDPDSVDANIRALASGITALRRREELKKVPLAEAQAAFFELLDQFFANPFSEMKRHGVTPHEIAVHMASTKSVIEAFASELEEFAAVLAEFWEYYGPVVHAHVEDLDCLKSVFGGDIFPSYTHNIACSVGLYVDTIVLPDPLVRAASFRGHMSPERILYYVVKHALNALTYKELALADVEPPIVVFAPSHGVFEEWLAPYLARSAEADLLEHCSRVFGRTFGSIDDLKSFLTPLSSPDQVASSVVDPSRLLFDADWGGAADVQVQKHMDDILREFGTAFSGAHAGQAVLLGLTGRMMQANHVMFESSQYRGCPLIDAPTSWQYLLWKYEYDRERSSELPPEIEHILVSRALQAQGSDELALISSVPAGGLIELRRRGAMAELREMLRRGIDEIDSATPSALSGVTETVAANIGAALSKHKAELAELAASKRRFFGFEIGRWITVASITIAAASTGNVPLSVAGASLLSLVGLPAAKDLWREGKALLSKDQQLKRSPTGILFRHL